MEPTRPDAASPPATPFAILGATDEFLIQFLNEDTARKIVTEIVYLPDGGIIPAHRQQAGTAMLYAIEGGLNDSGQQHVPGRFLTHAAGQVHGPHARRDGVRVLTVQQWQSKNGDSVLEAA